MQTALVPCVLEAAAQRLTVDGDLFAGQQTAQFAAPGGCMTFNSTAGFERREDPPECALTGRNPRRQGVGTS